MKMNKTKVVALALAVCLIAILSLGTLAWFTDDDSVTNNFYVAGSEDENPDKVFSVDVWEKNDPNGPVEQEGFEYDDILPGDDWYKEVNVENTGSYPQYVRTIVKVTDAHIWQQIYGEIYVPLAKIADDLSSAFQPWSIEYNADEDVLTYVLYYNGILEPTDVVNMFKNVHIPEDLDRYQAAEMDGGFDINVVAEAVQIDNVGSNAAEAFETVGMKIPAGNTTIMTKAAGIVNAIKTGALSEVVLPANYADAEPIVIDFPVSNVTIDADNQNATIQLKGEMENVVIENVKDNTDETPAVTLTPTASGNVTIKDCVLFDANSQPYGAIACANSSTALSVKVEDCTLEGKYALYLTNANDLTVIGTTFKGVTNGSWAIMVNGKATGNILVDGCTFEGCTGILKAGVAGKEDWQTGTTGNVTFTNNVLNNNNVKNGAFFATNSVGTVTVSGNTGNTTEIANWTNGLN